MADFVSHLCLCSNLKKGEKNAKLIFKVTLTIFLKSNKTIITRGPWATSSPEKKFQAYM